MELLIILACFAALSLAINLIARRYVSVADRGLYWSINLAVVPFVCVALGAWRLLTVDGNVSDCPVSDDVNFAFDCGLMDERLGAFFGGYVFILILPVAFVAVAIPITVMMERRRKGRE